jgi:predicted hotdog family 3-hydroxylacyl-ACP dehydratase
MKLEYPIPVSRFAEYVPHRPPMVWIDDVLSAGQSDGECRVRIDREALYMGGDRINPLSCVEWIAQGFAYVRAAFLAGEGRPEDARTREAFLVGLRNVEFFFKPEDEEVAEAGELRIRVQGFREYGPITLIDGEVRLPSGRVLMRGNLRVYHKG